MNVLPNPFFVKNKQTNKPTVILTMVSFCEAAIYLIKDNYHSAVVCKVLQSESEVWVHLPAMVSN